MIRYCHCAISFSPRKWQLLKHLSLLNGFPTAPATRFHSLRVYFQIMVWMGMADDMKPSEWEWKQENNQFIPIMTEKIAAPDELLKIIHCNCSGDANPLDAAADATDSPALLHVALAKLKTVTIQKTLKRSILRRRMALKTERSETYSVDKGVCAVGDSGQLKVMNSIS